MFRYKIKFLNRIKKLEETVERFATRINCLEGRHVWAVEERSLWLSSWASMFVGEPNEVTKPGAVKCKHCYIYPPKVEEKKRGKK